MMMFLSSRTSGSVRIAGVVWLRRTATTIASTTTTASSCSTSSIQAAAQICRSSNAIRCVGSTTSPLVAHHNSSSSSDESKLDSGCSSASSISSSTSSSEQQLPQKHKQQRRQYFNESSAYANGVTTVVRRRCRRPIYVSATRQHVGKTTTCMALMSGLQKRFPTGRVGFSKPVGQHCLPCPGVDGGIVTVDKDAAVVKQHFQLDQISFEDASPIVITKGYTKEFIDGRISEEAQRHKIISALERVTAVSDVVLCEGTGHTGVGSIVEANNARVASWIDARMVLIANGGLGKTMDELELNKTMCDKYGVELAGVIVNRVQPEKYEQTKYYLEKALQQKWNVPLLGCVPDRPFLGCPALKDFAKCLDNAVLVSGKQHVLRHYQVQDLELVATSLEVFLRNLYHDPARTLYVSHASREDILLGFLLESQQRAARHPEEPWEAAMIVTGCHKYPVSKEVLDMVASLDKTGNCPPVLLCSNPTHQAMEVLHHYTPKLNFQDGTRATAAVQHYEPYIDFELLLERVGYHDVVVPAVDQDDEQLQTAQALTAEAAFGT